MKKKLLIAAGAIAFAAGSALGYLALRSPHSAPASSIRVAMTPERIARGRHLFHHVADCEGCHSERDMSKFGGPVTRLAVGQAFPATAGFPGSVVAPNLTPDPETGLGRWSDGEKIRAIREGISRNGQALFPLMPYESYRKMSDEDVESLVAYLNTLEPVRNHLPRTRLDFPVSVLIKGAPQPVAGVVRPPDRSQPVAYGEYLATIGGCGECHTPKERGAPVAGREFAGGFAFATPHGTVVAANITPDRVTGIGEWSQERFVQRFLRHREDLVDLSKLPPATPFNTTLMPWLSYARMEPEELSAIYAYLQTVRPIRHQVEKHPSPR